MGHLFLDIETYIAAENEDSGLNPYYPESKVILIAYSYYGSFKPPAKHEIKRPFFLKEWESDERTIMTKFCTLLRSLSERDPYLKISGFNLLKFDLPYLFGRMKIHNLAPEAELHDLLFRPFGIDLFQLTPLISEKTKKHEQLWGINQKETSRHFGLQAKEGTGADCSRFYDRKEYDMIMKYCKEEFNFELMMGKFYLRVLRNSGNVAGKEGVTEIEGKQESRRNSQVSNI